MTHYLADKVPSVVITGASSGLGRATALAFAQEGANLALAARNVSELETVARECEALGAHAIAVETDVTDPQAVKALAHKAERAFGRIDVWVNNAGVGAVGRVEEVPIEAHKKAVETLLLGCMYGAHAALPHFIVQGSGVLINVNSFGAFVPAPYAASYAAGKWGLNGFSRSLRAELSDRPDIHVCDIYPPSLDTPGIQHGANYTGRFVKHVPPVYDPMRIAQRIVHLAHHPRAMTVFGLPSKAMRLGGLLAPGLMGWIGAQFVRTSLRNAQPASESSGNLFAASTRHMAVHGGWAKQNRTLGYAALGLAGAAGALLLLGARSRARVQGQIAAE